LIPHRIQENVPRKNHSLIVNKQLEKLSLKSTLRETIKWLMVPLSSAGIRRRGKKTPPFFETLLQLSLKVIRGPQIPENAERHPLHAEGDLEAFLQKENEIEMKKTILPARQKAS